MDSLPLINGKAYDYTDIIFLVAGVPTPSVSDINYTEEQDKKFNYGTGNRPVSYGLNSITAKCSFTISMNDVEALRAISIDGSLLSMPAFDIVVSFGNPQFPTAHTIKNFMFTDDGVETASGDTDIKRKFNGIASHIKWTL